MKRSIRYAIYSGLVLPGLGQLKNGDKLKGYIYFAFVILIVAGFSYSIATSMAAYFNSLVHLETMGDTASILKTHLTAIMKAFLYWGSAGIIVWASSGLDAYLVAKRKWGDRED